MVVIQAIKLVNPTPVPMMKSVTDGINQDYT